MILVGWLDDWLLLLHSFSDGKCIHNCIEHMYVTTCARSNISHVVWDQFRSAVAFVCLPACLTACLIAFLFISRFSLFLLLLLRSLCCLSLFFFNFMHFDRCVCACIMCIYIFWTAWRLFVWFFYCSLPNGTVRQRYIFVTRTPFSSHVKYTIIPIFITCICLSAMLNVSNRICVVLDCVHTLSSSRKWNTNEHKRTQNVKIIVTNPKKLYTFIREKKLKKNPHIQTKFNIWFFSS